MDIENMTEQQIQQHLRDRETQSVLDAIKGAVDEKRVVSASVSTNYFQTTLGTYVQYTVLVEKNKKDLVM